MRILYHVPVIHCGSDNGPIAHLVPRELAKTTEAFWDIVEQRIGNLALPAERLVVYQDAYWLSLSPERARLLLDGLARNGSRQARIVLGFFSLGARLEKTENFILPVAFVAATVLGPLVGKPSAGRWVRDRRDHVIAANINCSLADGEVGILFLGAAHQDFQKYLSSDVVLETVLDPYEAFQEAARVSGTSNRPSVRQISRTLREKDR